MLTRRIPIALAWAITLSSSASGQQRVDRAEHHEFAIEHFKTESGVTLPKAVIVYGTYGHLNADRSNAVLLPSHEPRRRRYLVHCPRIRCVARDDRPRGR